MTAPAGGFDVVTFLSDFGRRDVFVGVCHGVVVGRAPHVRIIDLTHEVDPHDVEHGAALLSRAVEHLPVAVHLAVVDPGVGTDRRGVAVSVGRGDVLVGPDNGLLLPAAEVLGGVSAAHELTDPTVRSERVSATFHGRDVFAPAAAEAANGTPPDRFGAAVTDLRELDTAPARIDRTVRELDARVALVDRFGNLQLDVAADVMDDLGFAPGDRLTVESADATGRARVVRTFGELAPGELGLYPDSDGRIALAVEAGSASEHLQARRGVRITVRPAGLADSSGG